MMCMNGCSFFCNWRTFGREGFQTHVRTNISDKCKKTSRATSNVGYRLTSYLKAPTREESSAFDFFFFFFFVK